MTISGYITNINKRYKTGISGEHAYREGLQNYYPGEKLGKVQINDEQYFGNVPLKAWEFTIGGYQPAEIWLKDRRDRTLSMEEIQHYQKIIVALMETGRIIGEVDGVFEIDS